MPRLLMILICLLLLAGAVVASEIKVTIGQGELREIVGYSHAEPGKVYLILPLKIENNGYDSVDFSLRTARLRQKVSGMAMHP